MNQVTPETTIGELCSYEEYKPLSDYFFTNITEDVWRRPLGDYGFKKCGFEETLERIKALVLTGQPLIIPALPQICSLMRQRKPNEMDRRWTAGRNRQPDSGSR